MKRVVNLEPKPHQTSITRQIKFSYLYQNLLLKNVLHYLSFSEKNNSETTKNSKNVTMAFNMSEIRQSVGDHRLLTSAELRMLIKQTVILDEQRVELYSGLGSSARYLATRFIDNQMKDKWLSFDVTEPLQKWLENNGKMTPKNIL